MAVSANRLELLQIADAVAREKSIDRGIVISGPDLPSLIDPVRPQDLRQAVVETLPALPRVFRPPDRRVPVGHRPAVTRVERTTSTATPASAAGKSSAVSAGW